MKMGFRGLFLILAWCVSAQALAQPNANAKKNEDAAQKARVNRPPLEPGSFDVGTYEMRSGADKMLPFFVGETRTINAELGTVIGYVFQLTGFTGTRLVPINTVIKHPPFTPKGESKPRTVVEEKTFFKPINGVMKWPFLYRFDTKEELVPGEWSMAVYYDTQLIAEHTFTVVVTEPKKP